ncbi:unnamed protein product [Urochloa decumbens]|uniref:Uncharacterized protein n=1 Tax=Urochloa decumbens TaxID=240449 RepID=A0ABC9CSG3_9POAL
MDQHGEKEAENNSQDSTEQRQDDTTAAAAEEDTSAQQSMDQLAGYKAEESAGLLIKDVVGSGEESSPPALFAHPCSLLQLLLRACAGCLGGYCGSDPKPPHAAAAAVDSTQEGEGGDDKANPLQQQYYMQGEVITRVWWAVRKPPGRPREGSGGNGGQHH